MTIQHSVPLRLMSWVMALCPLTLAVLVHTGFRSVPLAISAPRLPALAFNQYAVDLHKIHPTNESQAYFVFQNRGKEAVRITSMEPSCGCLTPRLQGDRDSMIEVGEHGRVIVRMQPANTSPGPHEYTVMVSYTDPEPQEVLLTMKLEIPPSTITVSPPALIAYHPAGSEPTVKDFVITDGRGTPFDVTDLAVNTDLVEAFIGETNRTAAGHFQQIVTVKIAGDLPPGNTQVLLRIMTTDPDFSEIRVPILLQGPVPPKADDADPALDHEHAHLPPLKD